MTDGGKKVLLLGVSLNATRRLSLDLCVRVCLPASAGFFISWTIGRHGRRFFGRLKMLDELIEAVENIDPPPCETTQCKRLSECKARSIACAAFYWYVTGPQTSGRKEFGKAIADMSEKELFAPTRQIYEVIYDV